VFKHRYHIKRAITQNKLEFKRRSHPGRVWNRFSEEKMWELGLLNLQRKDLLRAVWQRRE
jgi:hypothetical protein